MLNALYSLINLVGQTWHNYDIKYMIYQGQTHTQLLSDIQEMTSRHIIEVINSNY